MSTQTKPSQIAWESLLSETDGTDIACCGTVSRHSEALSHAEMAQSLQHPLAPSPPLAKLVVPGDRVVITLETGMRDAPECLAAVIGELQMAGVAASEISVLRTDKEARLAERDPRACLADGLGQAVQWLTHHRQQREALSYLASTRSDHRVYVHRALTEADVVLPIGTIRPVLGTDQFAVNQCWFPRFSDAETWRRFRPQVPKSPQEHAALHAESDEIAWLLGNQFQLQVIAGGDGPSLAALAGRAQELQSAGWERYQAIWNFPLARRVPFVVAEITGGHAEQTWSNLTRVLWQARAILEDGGVLAICSDLRSTPHRVLQPLLRQDDWTRFSQPGQRGMPDSLLVNMILHATENWRVYLLSQLPEHLVESLHMVHVSHPSEIVRLATRQRGVLFWRHAQYARPFAESEMVRDVVSHPRSSRKSGHA